MIGRPSSVEDMAKRVRGGLVLIGCASEPFNDKDWEMVEAALSADGVLLLMSDRKDVRDSAKQQIILRYGSAAGAA